MDLANEDRYSWNTITAANTVGSIRGSDNVEESTIPPPYLLYESLLPDGPDDLDYEIDDYDEFSRRRDAAQQHSAIEVPRPVLPITSQVSVENLEKVKIQGREVTCSVCLDGISQGSEAICMPCSHCYHERCITQWLEVGNNSCPMCRSKLSLS